MPNDVAAAPPDRRGRQSARDAALAAVPARQRERLLAAGADHGLPSDDPAWLVVESVLRARVAADAAETTLGEIRDTLGRLPVDIQAGAAGALRGAARDATREVADSIAAPAIAAIREAESRGARIGRIQALAAAMASATVIWVTAALTAAPVLRLPISERFSLIAQAPAWPLAAVELVAVLAVFIAGRSK